MKRDMELCRKILFEIEKKFISTTLYNLRIEGYDMDTVAYHCDLLYEASLISDCSIQYGDDEIYSFAVGSLTWEGHDFLDKISKDTVWNKTKEIIRDNVLPMSLDVIKSVANSVIASAVEGVIKGIK